MTKVASIVFNSFINDSRVLKEGLSLVHNGYHVEIIAHGDKGLPSYEENSGLVVRRLAYLDRTATKGKVGKLKAYFSFVKESVKYCKTFDILHCNDIHTLPIGFIVKKFFNKDTKIVYDAHEYETEMHGLNGISKIFVQKLERFLIKYVDKVITVSDAIANEYVKLYGIDKPALVLNTPHYKDIKKKELFRKELGI
jgi:glycosyltransferase involved in cell wall biosynthesis